jgi:hypothetical protein
MRQGVECERVLSARAHSEFWLSGKCERDAAGKNKTAAGMPQAAAQ